MYLFQISWCGQTKWSLWDYRFTDKMEQVLKLGDISNSSVQCLCKALLLSRGSVQDVSIIDSSSSSAYIRFKCFCGEDTDTVSSTRSHRCYTHWFIIDLTHDWLIKYQAAFITFHLTLICHRMNQCVLLTRCPARSVSSRKLLPPQQHFPRQ